MSPDLLSMPASVATANLKPLLWSGRGAGRLIRDFGVSSVLTEERRRSKEKQVKKEGEDDTKGGLRKGDEWWNKRCNKMLT